MILGFLFSLFLLYRLQQFTSPTGADGFFYLKQIQSLSDHAFFYYKDYSLAFSLPTLLNTLTHNPLLSFQLAICITVFLQLTLIQKILTHEKKLSAHFFYLLAVILMAFSFQFYDLNLTFYKTSFACIFLLFMVRLLQQNKIRNAVICSLFALASHKLMLAVIPLFWICWLIFQYKDGKYKISFKSLQRTFLALTVLTVVVGIILHQRLFLHATHLWNQLHSHKLLSIEFYMLTPVTVFFTLTLLLSLIILIKRSTQFSWILIASLILLNLPIVSPDRLSTENVSYRLFLVSFLFFPIVLFFGFQEKWLTKIFATLCSLLFVGYQYHVFRPLNSWQNPWQQRLTSVERLNDILPPDSLLYAPHGIQFYIAYKTHFRPRSFLIEKDLEKTYRVAFIQPYMLRKTSLLANDLEQLAVLKLGDEFAVFREADWLALNNAHMFIPHPMNLFEKKPAFLPDYE